MGQSTPTTTMAFGTFEARYREFRAELHPQEQVGFDRLLESARRHSNAINRRPHMDFERPVMLAMMMGLQRELDTTRAELRSTKKQLKEACHALADAGLLAKRVRAMRPEEMLRQGQRRLVLQPIVAGRSIHDPGHSNDVSCDSEDHSLAADAKPA